MPRVEKFAGLGPVGVMLSSCTIEVARTLHWGPAFRILKRMQSRLQFRSLGIASKTSDRCAPERYSADCITSTRWRPREWDGIFAHHTSRSRGSNCPGATISALLQQSLSLIQAVLKTSRLARRHCPPAVDDSPTSRSHLPKALEGMDNPQEIVT